MMARGDEKGMALLLVLLVVTLLSALVMEFSYEALIDLRMAETFRDRTRAGYIARGGIVAGQMFLREDRNGYDARDETWAQGLPSYPVDEGFVTISIDDLGGKLDLNRLVNPDGQPNAFFRDRLERLLAHLGSADSVELTAALIDWLDWGQDDQAEPYGAEDEYYRGLTPPYATKNGPLDTLEELLLVRGYDREMLEQLRPHVTLNGGEKVNINTTTAEVLASLAEGVSLAETREVMERVKDGPLKDSGQLQDRFAEEEWLKKVGPYLQVKSDVFRIHSRGEINEAVRLATAEINRADNTIFYLHMN